MIPFKPVTLDDRTAIERYTLTAETPHCDLSFANIYCWQERYESAWAEVGGFLVIRFRIDGGRHFGYMQPVGPGDFSPILPLLEEDAAQHGEPLRLAGLSEAGCALIRRACPGRYAFASDRAQEDYIYRADNLRRLPGRRYQPKRNHINRFTGLYPDYRYEPLTAGHAAECLALERAWRRAHGDTGECDGQTAESPSPDLCAEQRAMQRAFEAFEALSLRGGCIRVGEQLVAFTYGSAIGAETFDIHVEKADPEFVRDGAFTVINQRFAESLPEHFTLIDREEDLGIEGLRRAKLSYHPVALARKFVALHLDPAQLACRALWLEAFGDDEAFVDTFLVRYYDAARQLSVEHDRRLAAMLHLLEFESEAGRTAYIYGVATDPELRGQGLATRLMREALHRIEAEGYDAAALIPTPGMPWLRDFYGRFGFAGAIPVVFRSPDDFDFGTGDPADDRCMLWRRDASAALPETLTCRYRTA